MTNNPWKAEHHRGVRSFQSEHHGHLRCSLDRYWFLPNNEEDEEREFGGPKRTLWEAIGIGELIGLQGPWPWDNDTR